MDLRFKVWNGEMDVIEVLNDNHFCDGATVPTLLGRHVKTRQKFTASHSMYPCKTPKEAWGVYLDDVKNSIKNVRTQLDELIIEQDRLIDEYCRANKEMCKLGDSK